MCREVLVTVCLPVQPTVFLHDSIIQFHSPGRGAIQPEADGRDEMAAQQSRPACNL